MKRNEIRTGETYAVVTGSMYSGAEALAEPAVILETGVAIDNFNHTRWSSRPSSTSTDGVRVQLLDRKTMEPTREAVVKTRNIIATWADHTETMRLRAERKAQTAQRAKDTQEDIEAWLAKLGMQSYQMPSLGGSIVGGMGWDSEYTRNRAALVRMLQAAYDLGRAEASAE